MGVEVLDGLEDACALPLPAVELRLKIPAVTLPEGYVAAVEAERRGVGAYVGDEGVFLGRADDFFLCEKSQIFKIAAVGGDGYAIVAIAESLGELFLETADVFGREGNVGGCLVVFYGDGFLFVVDDDILDLYVA